MCHKYCSTQWSGWTRHRRSDALGFNTSSTERKIQKSTGARVHGRRLPPLPLSWQHQGKVWNLWRWKWRIKIFSCDPGSFRWSNHLTKTDELRDASLQMETTQLSRGSGGKERKEGGKTDNLLHYSWSFQQRCRRSRIHYRYQETNKSTVLNTLETWTRSSVLDSLVHSTRCWSGILTNKFWCHYYVPVCAQRMRREGCQRKWKERERELFAKQLAPRERPKENNQTIMGSCEIQHCKACLGKPRVICRPGTLTHMHQGVAIGRKRKSNYWLQSRRHPQWRNLQGRAVHAKNCRTDSKTSDYKEFFLRRLIWGQHSLWECREENSWSRQLRVAWNSAKNLQSTMSTMLLMHWGWIWSLSMRRKVEYIRRNDLQHQTKN